MSLVEAALKADTADAFSQVPVIDLKDASSTDPAVRRALGAAIRDVCINVGFFYGACGLSVSVYMRRAGIGLNAVCNHGISQRTIDNALAAMTEYFSLPLDEKMELDMRKSPNFKGYNPVLSSNNDPVNNGDMHEGFEFGWEELQAKESDEKRANDGVMAGVNVWPRAPADLDGEHVVSHAAVTLGKTMFPLFALALDLPEEYFGDKTKNSAALMRVLHYPPQTGPVDDRVIGIGAHTDFECFTILWQQPEIQALQVLNKQDKWIDAPPTPGTLVVNLGDQFARWTNDVFKSTVHRAVNRSGVRRYSIPLFFGTDYDVRLEPISSCVSEDRPPKYEVVAAGDYVKARLKATYGH
ncbi:uncharacterized protein FIBRA_05870 [Fibroporia radiculosa]|uniref:Fe2OG dioxygenase domain-containing protein n=1 Tax=Fibroporia radiculosa TaxID=599839 RepID=J4H3R9_9APHY|nr:uncharacterized protein FIBRA_05870 [Fibroporia radiculosa]CCM03724.1 predicted protein [Fibroporia radiculosa]